MTESNQGPATPGTAARCEGTTDEVCPKCTRIAIRLANQANAAEASVERLKAENASLRAALAAAREVNTRLDAQWAAAEKRNASLLESRDAWKNTAEQWQATAVAGEEKWRTHWNQEATLRHAAEQRAEAAEKALRQIAGIAYGGERFVNAFQMIEDIARAALHDEERPCLCHQGIAPDTCPYHGPLLRADEE